MNGEVGEMIIMPTLGDRRRITIVEMSEEGEGLNFPTRDLPNIKPQRRKKQAKRSLQTWNMMGADTETIEGKIWLFSTEKGVWRTPTFAHLMQVLYNDEHTKKWRNGKRKGRRCYEYFFWNLKFDAQAVLRTLSEQVILDLITSREIEGEIATNKVVINVDTADYLPIVEGRMVELSYLEGKSFSITPKNFYRGNYTGLVLLYLDFFALLFPRPAKIFIIGFQISNMFCSLPAKTF